MVKLPTERDLGGRPSVRAPLTVPSVDLQGPARAMQGMGKAVAGLGKDVSSIAAAYKSHQDAQDEYDTELRFQEFKYNHELEMRDRINNMEPGAAGFRDTAVKSYFEKAQGFLDSVPDSQKRKYDEKLFGLEQRTDQLGYSAERVETKRFAANQITDHANKLADKTLDLRMARADLESVISKNPNLTPVEKDELRREKLSEFEARHIENRINKMQETGETLADIFKDVRRSRTPSTGGASGDAVSRVLADKRRAYAEEIESDPRLKQFIRGLMAAENSSHPEGILESMMNRAHMRGRKSLWDEIKSGFYGPVNRGTVRPRSSGYDDAFERVYAGSNDISLMTDQGMRGEHKPAERIGRRPIPVRGEYYSEMGEEGVKWKQAIEEEAKAYRESGDEKSDAPAAADDGEGYPLYQYLTPKQRSSIEYKIRQAGSATAQEDVENLIDEVKLTGTIKVDKKGRNAIERNSAFLTKHQQDVYKRKLNEAKKVYDATAPLNSMTPEDAREHIAGLISEKTKKEVGATVAKKAHDEATRLWKKIADQRKKDPVETIAKDPDVKSAMDVLGAQINAVGLATDENGNIVQVEREQPPDPDQQRRAWGAIFRARLKAQEDRGVETPRLISEWEARQIVPNLDDDDPKALLENLKASAARADEMYGAYGEKVWRDAVALLRPDKESKALALAMVKRVMNGERPKRAFFDSLSMAQSLDYSDAWVNPGALTLQPSRIAPGYPALSQEASDMTSGTATYAGQAANQQAYQPNQSQLEWARQDPARRGPIIDRMFGAGTWARLK